MAKKKSPPRTTLKLQFRLDHAEDQHVLEILEYWKGDKKRITNVRKAIMLFYALENGDIEGLSKLFPGPVEKIRAGQAQPMFPDAVTIVQALDRLNNTMERIQTPVMVEREVEKPKLGGLKAPPQLQIPVFNDDDEPTLLLKVNNNTDSSMNFVTALKKLT